MKIKTQFYRKPPFLAILVVAVLLITVLVIHNHNHVNNRKNISNKPQSANGANSPQKTEGNGINDTRKSGQTAVPSTLTADPAAASAPFSAKVVSANVNNGNLHVGTLVAGVTSGTCTLTASQAGKQVVLGTSEVRQDVNNYSCGVFNVSTVKFPSSGTWQLTITVASSEKQAADTATITIPES